MEKTSINKKIYTAIKEGIFWAKATNKVRSILLSIRRFYFIDDVKVKELQHEVSVYRKLYKKYKKIIEQGVDTTLPRKHSDKVWICWLQGIENAPPLVRACIQSVKKNMIGKEVIVLTEQTLEQYITFPDYIIQKRKKGIIGPAHFSDLVRIGILCRYGGIWIDATVLCTASTEEFGILNTVPLFMYKQLNLTPRSQQPIVCSNWFISADSNSAILRLTAVLLWQYWRDYRYVMDYYIFHIFFTMATRRYPKEWGAVPTFNNHSPHVMGTELQKRYSEERWNQYLSMSSFHKLNRYVEYDKEGNSNYAEIIRKYS